MGHARLVPKDATYPMEVLIEFPYGVHSGEHWLRPDFDSPGIRMLGHLHNGVGTGVHVGPFTDHDETQVATLDYIKPLDVERSMVEMPIQAVYYGVAQNRALSRWDAGLCTTQCATPSS